MSPPTLLASHNVLKLRRSVLVFAIPYGGPVALVWGVSTRSIHQSLRHSLLSVVGDLRFLSHVHRPCHRRAWVCRAYLWRALLLDVDFRDPSLAKSPILDCRLCVAPMQTVPSALLHSHRCSLADSNSIGLIAGVASIDWGFAVQLMAAVSIGSNEAFVPTTGQT